MQLILPAAVIIAATALTQQGGVCCSECGGCDGCFENCLEGVPLNATSDPFALWIAEHGSLEGCCGCDCHCADCGGPCGPCLEADSADEALEHSWSNASLNPHELWILEHGSLEGCCGCDCHCAECGGACAPCAEEEVLAEELVTAQDPFALWIAEHGSLEGCCGCDCHCADCGGPCGPCLEDTAAIAKVEPVALVSNSSLNAHQLWILEHGSLEGCCGCDCHCAPCGGACDPCDDEFMTV